MAAKLGEFLKTLLANNNSFEKYVEKTKNKNIEIEKAVDEFLDKIVHSIIDVFASKYCQESFVNSICCLCAIYPALMQAFAASSIAEKRIFEIVNTTQSENLKKTIFEFLDGILAKKEPGYSLGHVINLNIIP